jgi:hypothetical protein
MVFGAGIGYLEWYKKHQLRRIENAFAPGYVSSPLASWAALKRAWVGGHAEMLSGMWDVCRSF